MKLPPSTRRRPAPLAGVVIAAVLLTACATDDDDAVVEDTIPSPAEEGQEDPDSAADAAEGAGATDACEELLVDAELEGIDGADEMQVREQLADLDLVEALDAVPALQPLASAFQTLAEDALDPASPSTLFAPVDTTAQTQEAGSEPSDDSADRTELTGEQLMAGHLVPDEVHRASELVDAGSVELADGTTLQIEQDDDAGIVLIREHGEARIICADIEVADARIHVIDGFLVVPSTEGADERAPGEEPAQPDDEGVRPDLREELDERDQESDTTTGSG